MSAGPIPTVLPGYEKDRNNPRSRRLRRFRYLGVTFGAFIYGFLYALLPPAFLSILLMPLAILTLFIIWALPVSDFAPPRALTICFWFYFATMYLWPNYLALALPGLPWITVARLFSGPMFLILLICTSMSGPFRKQMAEMLSAAPAIWKIVTAFAVIQFISIWFANDLFTVLNRFVSQQMMWTGVFFASVWVFRQPDKIIFWGRLLIALAVFVSVIGAIEARYEMVLWAHSIPSFLQVEDESVQRILDGAERNGIYRIVSTSMNPLNLAEFLALSLPFLIHELRKAKRLVWRLALAAADILIIYAIVLTDSRLGLVGAVTAHAVYSFLWMASEWKNKKGGLLAPAITISYPAIIAAVSAAILFIPRLRVTILGGNRTQASNDGRALQFEAFPDAFLRSPVFGHGSGRGATALGYANSAGTVTIDSYLLSMALDYGAVGFVCFFGMIFLGLGAAAKLALRSNDAHSAMAMPIALFMLCFFQIRLVLSNEFNLPLLFMLLGALVAISYDQKMLLSGKRE